MTKRTYRAPDGTIYPLTEATYPIAFNVYKSDRRKAKIGDPHSCIEALGIKRLSNVLDAYIGSGKDAYVIFKGNGTRPARAVHFVIRSKAAEVRDVFETRGSPKTQIIWLHAPSESRTLAARSNSNRRRAKEIKNGSPVKHRGPAKGKRVQRLGVHHRPRAEISKNNETSVPSND